jgi:hypothetical protein
MHAVNVLQNNKSGKGSAPSSWPTVSRMHGSRTRHQSRRQRCRHHRRQSKKRPNRSSRPEKDVSSSSVSSGIRSSCIISSISTARQEEEEEEGQNECQTHHVVLSLKRHSPTIIVAATFMSFPSTHVTYKKKAAEKQHADFIASSMDWTCRIIVIGTRKRSAMAIKSVTMSWWTTLKKMTMIVASQGTFSSSTCPVMHSETARLSCIELIVMRHSSRFAKRTMPPPPTTTTSDESSVSWTRRLIYYGDYCSYCILWCR